MRKRALNRGSIGGPSRAASQAERMTKGNAASFVRNTNGEMRSWASFSAQRSTQSRDAVSTKSMAECAIAHAPRSTSASPFGRHAPPACFDVR